MFHILTKGAEVGDMGRGEGEVGDKRELGRGRGRGRDRGGEERRGSEGEEFIFSPAWILLPRGWPSLMRLCS
jgi:hypothetical protein